MICPRGKASVCEGKVAIANAKSHQSTIIKLIAGKLCHKGANVQRLLWAAPAPRTPATAMLCMLMSWLARHG